MTLWTLLAIFAVIGAIFTFLTVRYVKTQKHWTLSFLQHFVGVWFVFSGFVKAVDPIGTALKLEEYFAEFKTAFACTKFAFLSSVMNFFNHYALSVGIVLIVVEIVLGLMLILGQRPKLTAWTFFVIMLVFTVLTGYTHLTGYVPSGGSFFCATWESAWKAENMRVTDCGCFGEFLKLKPTVSFYKDLGLMVVAFIYLFYANRFHYIFSRRLRNVLAITTIIVATLFCLQNALWDEPMVDFRPFHVGQNIEARKQAEAKALAEAPMIWKYKEKSTGKVLDIPNDQFMKKAAEYGNAEKWEFVNREQGDPSVPRTKISDFRLEAADGTDMTDSVLKAKGYMLVTVSGKIYAKEDKIKMVAPDTIWRDTLVKGKQQRILVSAKMLEKTTYKFAFDQAQAEFFRTKLNPLMAQAEKEGAKLCGFITYDRSDKLEKFRHETQAGYPFYVGDEKLIKTIMRSNPGLLLLKDGVIVQKWHKNHLPTANELKTVISR